MKNKKNILVTFFLLFLFCLHNNTKAFLDNDLGLNLYESIEKGVSEIEVRLYSYYLTNGGKTSISQRVNYLVGTNCLDDEMNGEEFVEIANGNLSPLYKHITDSCKNLKSKSIEINLIISYQKKINSLHKQIIKQVEKNRDSMYKIARIGLYSDGNKKNSPFDLISDMEEINSNIFTLTEKQKYGGTDETSLEEFFGEVEKINFMKPTGSIELPKAKDGVASGGGSFGLNNITNGNNTKINKNNNSLNNVETKNKTNSGGVNNKIKEKKEKYPELGYLCLEENNTNLTGLNSIYTKSIIQSIEKNYKAKKIKKQEKKNITNSGGTDNNSTSTNADNNQTNNNGGNSGGGISGELGTNSDSSIENSNPSSPAGMNSGSEGGLKEISADKIFKGYAKCTDFFCVFVDFQMYEQNLLDWGIGGGGGGNGGEKNIETTVKKSNEHLRKFSYTDLTQKQQAIQQWENLWKNLDFKKLLNLKVLVVFRSPNIEGLKDDKDRNSENDYKTMINKYYSKFGLKYDNANKIDKTRISSIKSIMDSVSNDIYEVSRKYKQYTNEESKMRAYEKSFSDIIYTKQKLNNMESLDKMFYELASFTNVFEKYVQNLRLEILDMNEKDTW